MAPLAPPPPPPPPVTLPSSSVPVPSDSILNKTQKWVEDNKYLVLGAAIAAAGGVGYYLYSANQAASAGTGGRLRLDSSDEEETIGSGGNAGTKSTSSKKKKKSKSKKSKTGESGQGPLLEERDPEEVKKLREKQALKDQTSRGTTDEVLAEQSGVTPAAGAVPGEEKSEESDVPAHLASAPSAEALKTMSNAERNKAATELKNRGNKLYASKQFEFAIECYSKALEVADKEEAIYYSNRAACYQNMSPPNYDQVVKDCDAALKLDSGYVKALNRRATALENLGRDVESLRDFTALTIMERFQNEAAATSVERVLQKIAKNKAAEMLKTREPRLPSVTFVAAYLNAFRPAPKPTAPDLGSDSTNTGNNTLLLAIDAEAAGRYEKAFMLVNEAVDQGISEDWVEGRARSYNMRGTYKFLMGDTAGAKEDLEESLRIKPDYVQSLVKVASVHMEMGDAAAAFGDFEDAIRHNAEDPDIYYHRGQLYFVTNEYTQASSDYEKSTSLDDTFVFSQVQRAVCQYKMEDVRGSMNAFRQLLKKFPGKSEPLNYYGELLLDQQRFEDAAEKFDAAIEIEKDKQPCNVLPFVNKALALFQWKQDMPAAESLCKKALDIDPECDVAIATLAQLSLQQGKIADAIEWFERSAKLARTEAELTTAITYEHASRAQLDFLQNYPQMAEKLGQLAGQI